MIKTFSIYNEETGIITRRISCPQEIAVNQLGDEEFLIPGDFDDAEYKVVNGAAVMLTQQEKAVKKFHFRKDTFPTNINNGMDEGVLNAAIDEYFMGFVDVPAWRIENYSALRSMFYPPYSDALDAEIKIRNNLPEGEIQRKEYDRKCMEIKSRFPKEENNNL
nr:hypothetical protein [Desulfobacula sp.]